MCTGCSPMSVSGRSHYNNSRLGWRCRYRCSWSSPTCNSHFHYAPHNISHHSQPFSSLCYAHDNLTDPNVYWNRYWCLFHCRAKEDSWNSGHNARGRLHPRRNRQHSCMCCLSHPLYSVPIHLCRQSSYKMCLTIYNNRHRHPQSVFSQFQSHYYQRP